MTILVKDKIMAMAKNGKPYMNLRFMDKSGEVDAKVCECCPTTAVMTTYGVDSFVGRLASILQGAADVIMKPFDSEIVRSKFLLLDLLRRGGLMPGRLAWPLMVLCGGVLIGYGGRNELLLVLVATGVALWLLGREREAAAHPEGELVDLATRGLRELHAVEECRGAPSSPVNSQALTKAYFSSFLAASPSAVSLVLALGSNSLPRSSTCATSAASPRRWPRRRSRV